MGKDDLAVLPVEVDPREVDLPLVEPCRLLK
jgi:hypothetical protein